MPILEVGKTYETRNNFYQVTSTQGVAWTEGPYYVEIIEQATSGTHPFKGAFRYSPDVLEIISSRDSQNPLFSDSFGSLNSTLWRISNNFSNEGIYNVGWVANNVIFSYSTGLRLVLNNTPGSGKPYSSGELKSKGFYGYGSYKTSFIGSAAYGTITTVGLKTDNGLTDLITINLRGEYPTKVGFKIKEEEILIETGINTQLYDLEYEIKWTPNKVDFYINNQLKYTKNTTDLITNTTAYLVANLWTSTSNPIIYSTPTSAYIRKLEYIPTVLALYGGRGVISTEDGYGLFYTPNGIYTTTGTFHDLDLIQEVDSDTLNKLEGKITQVDQVIINQQFEDLFRSVYDYGINEFKQQLTDDDLLTLATLYKQAFDTPTYNKFIQFLQGLL